jgi:predicted deacetylase
VKALVSIHDVMPHTMDRVERILGWLRAREVPPVTLLVVPGRPWSEKEIERLREFAAQGHPLAAHGWLHKTIPRKLYHRIHAALLSRNVAEHLDLDSAGVLQLMVRSRDWFRVNELPVPDFYVPPAWALGPVSTEDLLKAPYKRIETTRGLIHLKGGGSQFEKLPLTGYEADTPFREFFLRRWNAAQFRKARAKALPLRISIHPDDLELRIADQLDEQIRAVSTFLTEA